LNILIVKLSALGDVTYTLPALTALRRAHPEAHISWLVEDLAAPVVTGHRAVNRVLVWRRRDFSRALRTGHWLRAFGQWRQLVRELRDRRYDLVIDFQGLMKSALWSFLAPASRKVGFGPGLDRSEGSYWFYSERITPPSMEIHALERALFLLEAIGIPRGPVEHNFPIQDADTAKVAQLLNRHPAGGNGAIIAVHPMTRWETKLWRSERFAEVADALTAEGHRVVFTGTAADAPALDAIFSQLRRPALRLDGKLSLNELAALFRQARVVISTDTGPMHIAAAVETPVVAIFGPTAPNRTGPWGKQHTVVRAGVECSPCFSRRCTASVAEPMACMNQITSARILTALRNHLHAASA
jgi:lipopolysaccharide heptosyltransferase I